MKALTWLVGLAMALAVLKVTMQAALVIFAIGLLLAFIIAPKATFAVLAGLMLIGLFVHRPEYGLGLIWLVVLASLVGKR